MCSFFLLCYLEIKDLMFSFLLGISVFIYYFITLEMIWGSRTACSSSSSLSFFTVWQNYLWGLATWDSKMRDQTKQWSEQRSLRPQSNLSDINGSNWFTFLKRKDKWMLSGLCGKQVGQQLRKHLWLLADDLGTHKNCTNSEKERGSAPNSVQTDGQTALGRAACRGLAKNSRWAEKPSGGLWRFLTLRLKRYSPTTGCSFNRSWDLWWVFIPVSISGLPLSPNVSD
jgi:hypothetical protein